MFQGIIKRFAGLLSAFRNVTFWSGFSKNYPVAKKIQDTVKILDAYDLL